MLWIIAFLIGGQAVMVAAFVRALLRAPRAGLTDAACPKAAVVLCLRGPDPFLDECLTALVRQDYPDYQVIVVVDHPDDAVRQQVESVVTRFSVRHLSIHMLTNLQATCSLKCSSLVQAVSSLDPSVEIVAQLDADTVPHRTWLRELAGALADDRVAAATGNRWYMPATPAPGSLVRYLWNVSAVVQMYLWDIPWGGSLALKTRVIRETGLLDRWSTAFCEDTMLPAELRRHGYRVQFVPSLMMINREACDVSGFYGWVQRQFLTTRLYHPAWPALLATGALTALFPIGVLGVSLVSALRLDASAALWFGTGFVVYQLAMVMLAFWLEAAVRRIPGRGPASADESPLGPARALTLFTVMPLAQVVCTVALATTAWLRTVEWRGITYQIEGPWDIRLEKYEPFAATAVKGNPLQSL